MAKTWKSNEYFSDSWRFRVERMASYVENESVIADLGCGKQWLRECLSGQVEYIPVDYKLRTGDTLVCDFNRSEFPNIYVDVSFISGVLEYVDDIDWFSRRVINHTEKKIILSYCDTGAVSSRRQRRSNMWVNDCSKEDICKFFSRLGFELYATEAVGSNTIYVLTRKHALKAYGVLVYQDQLGNLGDYTQALAAIELAGEVFRPVYLQRESLDAYRGKCLPVICNGWFSHKPILPPDDKLSPLYISLHITPAARKWFSTKAMIDHLKKHAPIGCRDKETQDFLLLNGVDAYFSGCLTYALGMKLRKDCDAQKSMGQSSNVYLIDPPVKLEKQPSKIIMSSLTIFRHLHVVPGAWRLTAGQGKLWRRLLFLICLIYEYRRIIRLHGVNVVFQTQYLNKDDQLGCEVLFDLIKARLMEYCRGLCVVTGRIHVAIPAHCMGAKVVFVLTDKLGDADRSRMIDHVDMFAAKFVMRQGGVQQELVDMVSREEIPNGISEGSLLRLVELQELAIGHALRTFYENSDLC